MLKVAVDFIHIHQFIEMLCLEFTMFIELSIFIIYADPGRGPNQGKNRVLQQMF